MSTLTETERRLDEQFTPDAETQRRIDLTAQAVAHLVESCPSVTARQLRDAVCKRFAQI